MLYESVHEKIEEDKIKYAHKVIKIWKKEHRKLRVFIKFSTFEQIIHDYLDTHIKPTQGEIKDYGLKLLKYYGKE